ncbi:MAG: type II toxin-antitoxin system VapC family toxin [Isosphaeraceae bacterium]|nr:type II toxin-antitoxin system VapC family toxin [Isosphaeraceae bacterium]
MRTIFADTFYYLALLSPRDTAHSQAITISVGLSARLVTTEYVLTKVADALAASRDRPRFLGLLATQEADPDVTIIPASPDLFQRGVDLYRRRPDKDWPLTDCLSFVVMGDVGATEALTGDHHFQQAGFVALLLKP